MFPLFPSNDSLVCSDFNVSVVNLTSLVGLKGGCNPRVDVVDCLSEDVLVCDKPVSGSVLCSGDGGSCTSVFVNSSCRLVTTYHGPFCEITPSCRLSITVQDFSFQLPLINSESPGSESRNFSSCKPLSNSSFKTNNTLFYRSSFCGEERFCGLGGSTEESPSGSGLYPACLAQNSSLGESIFLIDVNGQSLFCDDYSSQNYGDYWCPEGYHYTDTGNVCYKNTATCDKGFAGNLQFGCDSPFSPANDTLFSAYQSECVFQTPALPPGIVAYDSVCCLDSVFNGYQIWKEEPDSSHVRVY